MTSHSLHLLKPPHPRLVVRGAKKFFLEPTLNPSYADSYAFPSRSGWRDEDGSRKGPRAAQLSPKSSKVSGLLVLGAYSLLQSLPARAKSKSTFVPQDCRP